MRPYAVTRQLTGTPRVHRAYVRDATDQKVLIYCDHGHRGIGTAERCAKRMLRNVLASEKKQSADHE